MRLYRQIKHLRRAVKPNLNKSRNPESHLMINRDKTKKNYIYFDNIYQKSTNTFVTRHSTSVQNSVQNKITNNSNRINNKKINFSTRENSDTYIIDNELSNYNFDSLNNLTSKESASSIALLSKNSGSTVFAYNSSNEEDLKIPIGNSIPFNNLSLNFGHNIDQIKNDEFKINSPGIYKIDFIIYTTTSSPLGSVGIVVDDNPVETPITLTIPGTPLISHGLLDLKDSNHIVKIEISNLDLYLNTGKNASIIIEKLN